MVDVPSVTAPPFSGSMPWWVFLLVPLIGGGGVAVLNPGPEVEVLEHRTSGLEKQAEHVSAELDTLNRNQLRICAALNVECIP